MDRKIIGLAGNTLVISLPQEWVKKYKLLKGNTISLEMSGPKILISLSSKMPMPAKEIELLPLPKVAYRILGSLYKAGYDIVSIKSESDIDELEEVGKREFIGFEITKKEKGKITLSAVSKIDFLAFDNMLRRSFLIALEMAEEGAKKPSQKLVQMDFDVNKYTDFCRRVINSQGFSKPEFSAPTYFIVEELEKISDAFRDLVSYGNPPANFKPVHIKLAAYFRMMYELYYTFSQEKLLNFKIKHDELKKDILELNCEVKFSATAYNALELIWNTNGAITILRI